MIQILHSSTRELVRLAVCRVGRVGVSSAIGAVPGEIFQSQYHRLSTIAWLSVTDANLVMLDISQQLTG